MGLAYIFNWKQDIEKAKKYCFKILDLKQEYSYGITYNMLSSFFIKDIEKKIKYVDLTIKYWYPYAFPIVWPRDNIHSYAYKLYNSSLKEDKRKALILLSKYKNLFKKYQEDPTNIFYKDLAKGDIKSSLIKYEKFIKYLKNNYPDIIEQTRKKLKKN